MELKLRVGHLLRIQTNNDIIILDLEKKVSGQDTFICHSFEFFEVLNKIVILSRVFFD